MSDGKNSETSRTKGQRSLFISIMLMFFVSIVVFTIASYFFLVPKIVRHDLDINSMKDKIRKMQTQLEEMESSLPATGRNESDYYAAGTRAKALYNKGNKEYSNKQYAEAYESFSKASKLGFKQADYMLTKLKDNAKTLYESAYILQKADPQKALSYLDIVRQIVPPDDFIFRRADSLATTIHKNNLIKIY